MQRNYVQILRSNRLESNIYILIDTKKILFTCIRDYLYMIYYKKRRYEVLKIDYLD